MAAYAVGAALAFAALAARRRRQQLLAAALALGVVVAIYTSEGRSNIVAGLVIAITFGMLTLHSRRRVVSMFALAAVGLVAFALVQAAITGLGGGATRFKGLGPTALLSTTDQARGGSIAEIPQLLVSYPLGAGLGVAGPASSTSGGPVATRNINAESEVAFLIDETGIPGLLVMTGFLITLFVIAVRRCPRIEDRETRLLLAATVAPIGAILPLWLTGGGLTATVPGGPFIWAIGGIVSYWLIRREEAA
jgi:O-antigen ligase